ncbi:signal peptide, CUB and EGF-like domain-containing protein 2 [Tachypleus tridentatus]|uniref:signal peptide, CUB and EGF-like domain-containing protein 2 n=1 Tax=Tachypleus tridentatus TaxID=6853 RepID=UPI003FD4C37F
MYKLQIIPFFKFRALLESSEVKKQEERVLCPKDHYSGYFGSCNVRLLQKDDLQTLEPLYCKLYVPAENLNCTRGCRRDADRCYPCSPGHYDNGFQTYCLPCPEGTYMTSFAADACVAYPEDEITAEEGADNKYLCKSNGIKEF